MRDIKFRGKRIDNGEWETGFYLVGPQSDALIRTFAGWQFKVDPETVGQYTGLKDRNCKEIYEGDIVQYKTMSCGAIGVVSFGEYEQDGSGGEYGGVTCFGWYIDRKMVLLSEWDIECGIDPEQYREEERQISPLQYGDMEIEVIGNIHDNPELRTGGNP